MNILPGEPLGIVIAMSGIYLLFYLLLAGLAWILIDTVDNPPTISR